jgi:hypothetical protein
MHHLSVRRRTVALSVLAAGTLAVACGGEDKRIEELSAGITRDSAVTVIAQELKGGVADSFPNVFIRERYLIAGKNYEVLYFTPDNVKGETSKDTSFAKLTPIVFAENLLVAKGWRAWDSISKANNIPVKDRSEKKAEEKK